ncbi:MAG: type VI secretion system baseplate subunit TssF [Desulfobacterales bacterium]|nr:type VI secretion system baseplate subunit TssF [Desulfobacterales bacterium]
MINRYFQSELASLRDLGADYAKTHPAVAPMLSGMSADPDVERLLEGVAFLTALLRQKLDDEFPEIIHELMRLVLPHYLRPLPSAAMVAFTPKPTLKQPATIPAGIQVAAVPVEGTSCLFQTCYPVDLHPLQLLEASFTEASGTPPSIKLLLELTGPTLADWQPSVLRFMLAADFTVASDLYFLFGNHLKTIRLTAGDTRNDITLGPEYLKPVGFNADEGMIPYSSNSFIGYRIIQEYFHFPEKYLFLDLYGWEQWQNRGEGSRFEITFELDKAPIAHPRVKASDFVLFASPVINIFPFSADPIHLDHRKTQYRIRPHCTNDTHYEVYSVEQVTGLVQGTAQERPYFPFDAFQTGSNTNPMYHINTRSSPMRSGLDVMLSVAYPLHLEPPVAETLSIQLLCTNGNLPENIQAGDICLPTSSTPEFVEFKNLRPPTGSILPPLGSNLLWRLISHLSLNYASLANAGNLRALLDTYIFEDQRDRAKFLANQKRVAGIENLESTSCDRLISGILMRGREIHLDMRQDHFAGLGDLFLFGSILDCFLGLYASINTYTRLTIKEVMKGDTYQWPERLGEHPLI